MNELKYQDISDIIFALCVANTEIEYQLKEAKEMGSKTYEEWRLKQKEDIQKGFDAVSRLRKGLCLAGDPLYSNKH